MTEKSTEMSVVPLENEDKKSISEISTEETVTPVDNDETNSNSENSTETPIVTLEEAEKKSNDEKSTEFSKVPLEDEEKISDEKKCTKMAVVTLDDEDSTSIAKVEIDGADPWALVEPPRTGKPWNEMNCFEKLKMIFFIIVKCGLLVTLLYTFVCSLSTLSDAFRLLGGKAAGKAFSESSILSNPISNLMMGILATVLLQSSSTTTSIIVSMVASGLLNVRQSIFIIMGANIGTSVTNTIVSVTQINVRSEFRRAFAGATIHDMFNWLSVICLLPMEWVTGEFGSWKDCGLICQITLKATSHLEIKGNSTKETELLKALTKPVTQLIIRLDKIVLGHLTTGHEVANETLVKHFCLEDGFVATAVMKAGQCSVVMVPAQVKTHCHFIFESFARTHSNTTVGIILLALSLFVLCSCLVLIVKILHSLLQGNIAMVLRTFVNAEFPGVFRHLTGYVAICLGAGFTMLVQSSSIFTSALTPLVGVGILHLDRMYPLTLGANIGTTFTAILAALASDRRVFQKTLQVALSHLCFNIFGILIWYPIPIMRTVPIGLAKILGSTTAKYRWFAIFYLVVMFFIIPAIVFFLSMAGTHYLLGIGIPIMITLILVGLINSLQRKAPDSLPSFLRNWNFLPHFMHSLAPLDKCFMMCFGRCACFGDTNDEE